MNTELQKADDDINSSIEYELLDECLSTRPFPHQMNKIYQNLLELVLTSTQGWNSDSYSCISRLRS